MFPAVNGRQLDLRLRYGMSLDLTCPVKKNLPARETGGLLYPQGKPLRIAAVLKGFLRTAPFRKEPEGFRANRILARFSGGLQVRKVSFMGDNRIDSFKEIIR